MPDSTIETKTYTGQTGTSAFDGYKGLRIGQRYVGTPQEDGDIWVSAVGAPIGSAVVVTAEQWRLWFEK